MELDPPPASVDEATSRLPQGAYTTLRTFEGPQLLRLDEHLARLEESARLSGVEVYLDWPAVRAAVQEALDTLGTELTRVRLTLDTTQAPGTLYLVLAPLRLPSQQEYEDGVRAITCDLRRENPKAKTTAFISSAAEVRQTLQPGIHEAIMVDADGRVLEGLSSNFFAIRDGEIWTADEGVLPGITRSVVLEEAAACGAPIHLEGLPADELKAIDEAFITSSSRGVLPVVEIDGHSIGDGRPGPITRRLQECYNNRITRELEPLQA